MSARRLTPLLGVVVLGALLQIAALPTNFYRTLGQNGELKDAWFGIPHASDLILVAALVGMVTVALVAADRLPLRGRTMGLLVGTIGLLATAQLVYRMKVPPFGCLQYGCGTTAKVDVDLLTGIYVALAGSVIVTLGGFAYAFSSGGRAAAARPWRAATQTGMTPWLGMSAVGALAMFVFPFTAFTLYEVQGFFGSGQTQPWGGWLSLPHTSSFVLVLALGVVGLVVAAGRERSPLGPRALGITIAVLAFLGGARILYRLFVPPFTSAGGASDVRVGDVQILLSGYLGVAAALVAVVAGIVHSRQQSLVGQSSEARVGVSSAA